MTDNYNSERFAICVNRALQLTAGDPVKIAVRNAFTGDEILGLTFLAQDETGLDTFLECFEVMLKSREGMAEIK